MKLWRSSRDASDTIADVDYHTGRVLRIPGIYPWHEVRVTRALLVAVVVLLVLLGVQTLRLAAANEAHAQQLAEWADAARAVSEQYRAVEQQRAEAQRKVVQDAAAQVDLARRDAGRARLAHDRLRDAAITAGGAASDPAFAGPGATTAGPGLVLANVLIGADGAAGELAASLDEARAAGLACEQSYDSLLTGN